MTLRVDWPQQVSNDVNNSEQARTPRRPAISSGLFGQVSPPPAASAPVSNSAPTAADPDEEAARKAVSMFIEARYPPDWINRPEDLVERLKNSAIEAAKKNLAHQQQLAQPNPAKVELALSLLRQAMETHQGVAETGRDIVVGKKIPRLFALEQSLMRRCNDPRQALTAEEKQEVATLINDAKTATNLNQVDWVLASSMNPGASAEPYGDAPECEAGLIDATAARKLVIRISDHAELYVKELEGARPQTKTP